MLPLPFMKRWRKNGVLITSNFVVAYRFILFVFLSSASLRYPLLLFILYPLPSYLNSSLLFSIPPSFLLYICSSLSFSSLTPFPPHFSFIIFFSLSIPGSFLLYLLLPLYSRLISPLSSPPRPLLLLHSLLIPPLSALPRPLLLPLFLIKVDTKPHDRVSQDGHWPFCRPLR